MSDTPLVRLIDLRKGFSKGNEPISSSASDFGSSSTPTYSKPRSARGSATAPKPHPRSSTMPPWTGNESISPTTWPYVPCSE